LNIKITTSGILLATVISITVLSVPLLISIQMVAAQKGPSGPLNNFHILKVGIRAYNSGAEFGPIVVGRASIASGGYFFSPSVLHYNDPNSFALNGSKLVTTGMNVILKGTTLSSNPLKEKNVNYIEGSFRTLFINNSKDYHNGIAWNDGQKHYYAFLRSTQLVIFTPDRGEISWVPAVHNIGKWDTLKVIYINGVIHVFLNNVQKIQLNATTTTNTKATSNQEVQLNATTTTNTKATSNQEECSAALTFMIPCV
jgi:hypothetical protein